MKADIRRIKTLEMAQCNAQIKADRSQRHYYVFPTKTRGVFVVDSNMAVTEGEYDFNDAVYTANPVGA